MVIEPSSSMNAVLPNDLVATGGPPDHVLNNETSVWGMHAVYRRPAGTSDNTRNVSSGITLEKPIDIKATPSTDCGISPLFVRKLSENEGNFGSGCA